MIDAVAKRLVGVPLQSGIQQTQKNLASSAIASPKAAQTLPLVPISRQRLATYQQWEKLHRGQRQLHQLELSSEGVKQLLKLLGALAQQLQQSTPRPAVVQRLLQRLLQWQQDNGSRFGIDHRLTPVVGQASPRWFSLRSVDLLSPRQHDERLQINALGQQHQLVLQGGANRATLRQQLSDGLAPLGIVVLGGDELQFAVEDKLWGALQQGLAMEGQGQRLPAGQSRPLKLQEQFHQHDPRGWGTLDTAQQRQQVNNAISRLSHSQTQLEQQLTALLDQVLGKNFEVDFAALELRLSQLKRQLQPQSYQAELASLMAQANLSRSQSTALLAD
ncbi:hypothetical protein [uncultured Ferrimonas sp.]|uniref:hypothetical protein n=1 Tax=uncultured Ferrimonas sp. TaxID=432640 RepID=UPI00260695B2|nr:hypothetical protein [uncultured Ferrimonas sp.]